jgi:sugar O-acyltransferase (sialic acid O-acetyltransferase NeuD family)
MNLYIYCAGGYGKEVLDIAVRVNNTYKKWDQIFFIDDIIACKVKNGHKVFKFEELDELIKHTPAEFVIANGEPVSRKKIFDKLIVNNYRMTSIIDCNSIISAKSTIAHGVIISPLCSISSDATLMNNSTVNTMSIIGHDVVIGENSVISSMVNIGGESEIGDGTYIGMGALVKEKLKIGNNVIVGMGSVVYNDIPDNMIALGNPARVVRRNDNKKIFQLG